MNKKIQIVTKSAKETQKLGFNLARHLSSSQVIALKGDLGSGKTTLLQGLALGLGIKETVNSPTFNVLKRYNLKTKIKGDKNSLQYFYHIDTYRLNNSSDLINLGWEEILNTKNSIIAIEWAEKVRDILPQDLIFVHLQYVDEVTRKATITHPFSSNFELISKNK
jgi:tRNA threonylcarbamoyladenosine biosynthesis protein TsaE